MTLIDFEFLITYNIENDLNNISSFLKYKKRTKQRQVYRV